MGRPRTRKLIVAEERQAQAILDKVAATVERLELEHTMQQAITEQIFDSSRVAVIRAVHSADFIHRLIEITPSLTEHQHHALRGIADDLIQLARPAPQEVRERVQPQQPVIRDAGRPPDLLDDFLRDMQAEWEGLKVELASVTRFWRK